jgi:LemA protein
MVVALVLLALAAVAAVTGIAIYNGLVGRRNAYRNAFSQIDVQLKRRHDLVPNLVETAKAYLEHERETLESVVRARGQAAQAIQSAARAPGDPVAMQALAGAEGALSASLSRLLAVAEAYPDLKANATMASLMEELASTENRIAFARQAYNDAIMDYGVARESFPGTLVASSFGFREAAAYETAVGAEREPVKVSF